MKKLLGRRRLVVGLGILAAPVVAASIAYACGALATMSLNPGQGDPGTTINGVGRGFSSQGEPVVVRFGGSKGQVLWSGRPDANGSTNMAFQVPNVNPGSYTIMATQNNQDGQPVPGSPARAELTVTGRPIVNSAPTQQAGPSQQPVATSPAAAPQGANSVAPAAASPAPQPAAAGSVDPATGQVVTPAPAVAPAAQPAPGAAPVAAPVPAVGSANRSSASNVAPRSTMVGTRSSGSPALPLALVGAGLVLTLAATASVIAGRRREDKALSLADGRR